MQITTNYSQNTTPNFTAFTMHQSSHRRFMRALRQQCKTDELLIIRNTMETQKNNPNNIRMVDLGGFFGEKVDGHLVARIKNKEYANTLYPLFTNNPISKFIERVANKAEKGRPVKLTKSQILEQKALTQSELATLKKYRENGMVTEKEQRGYLLGEIYKMIK